VLRWGSYEVRREDLRAAHGEGEVEAVRVLAAGGHLTGGEIEEIREAALEAAERIGTDREQGTMTATGWEPFTADRLAVAIAEKMEAGSG
jgi:hypothetical protein